MERSLCYGRERDPGTLQLDLFASRWFSRVNEDCVGVCGMRHLSQVQAVANRASVISAVIDDVKEDLQTRHGSMLPIDKLKGNSLTSLARLQVFDITNKPLI